MFNWLCQSNPPPAFVKDALRRLPDSFVPDHSTVICGRGKKCTNAPGNRRLKSLVTKYLKEYANAENRAEKSYIVVAIVEEMRLASSIAAFVKFEMGSWWEVDDCFAREKIGCLFRESLGTQYRSSYKSKIARRKRREAARLVLQSRGKKSSSMVNKGEENMCTKTNITVGPLLTLRSVPSTKQEFDVQQGSVDRDDGKRKLGIIDIVNDALLYANEDNGVLHEHENDRFDRLHDCSENTFSCFDFTLDDIFAGKEYETNTANIIPVAEDLLFVFD